MKAILFALTVSFVLTVPVAAQNSLRVISNPDPMYPPEAAQLGYGGTVKLAIKVDKQGKVKVLEAWGPNAPCSNQDDGRIKNIRNAVVDTASKVEFEPPADEGKPSDVEMTVSYSFDSSGQPFRASTRSEAKGRIVEAGVLMGRVKHLAKPDYPLTARANRLGGTIPISVLVDIDGKVIAASALGGHKILQGPALIAACRSSIEPVQLSGVPVQVSGVILFAFLS